MRKLRWHNVLRNHCTLVRYTLQRRVDGVTSSVLVRVLQSAIDFEMSMERQADPKGDRVKIVLSGKNLGYRRY